MEDNKDAESKETATTVQDVYDEIDGRVQKFTKEFIDFLPSSDATSFNAQLIVDRLLTVKESAKLLINNFMVDKIKKEEEAENKENKDD